MDELRNGLDFVCDGGLLLGVDACFFDRDPAFVTAVRFRFALCPVAFYAVADDDTVTAQCGENLSCEDGPWVDVSDRPVWADCVGRHAVWAWLLTNQQGYRDGIRIEFESKNQSESRIVELVVLASAFSFFVASAYSS